MKRLGSTKIAPPNKQQQQQYHHFWRSNLIGATNGKSSFAKNHRGTLRSPVFRHFVSGTLFAFVSAALFFYWAAFPLLNTVFVHGYPRFAIAPSPNKFKSARYGWDWWHVWILSLNGLLPLTFMLALSENRTQEYARVHALFSSLLSLASLWVFGVLLVRTWFWCNVYSSPHNTACNDYRYCGVHFVASAEATEWCPNVAGFVPPVTASDLGVNSEYTQHIVFAAVFSVMALFHLGMSQAMSRWGVFANQAAALEEEDDGLE